MQIKFNFIQLNLWTKKEMKIGCGSLREIKNKNENEKSYQLENLCVINGGVLM